MSRKKQVLVIGDSAEFPEKNKVAYQIGQFIAENNWVLLTGGLTGIMNAASQGASEKNGLVIAISPYDDIEKATPYASVVIATGMGYARNYINALSCDVVVVVGGGTGTLGEMTYAWQANKPIIACAFLEGWGKELAGKILDYRRNDPVITAKTLEEVFLNIKKYL